MLIDVTQLGSRAQLSFGQPLGRVVIDELDEAIVEDGEPHIWSEIVNLEDAIVVGAVIEQGTRTTLPTIRYRIEGIKS